MRAPLRVPVLVAASLAATLLAAPAHATTRRSITKHHTELTTIPPGRERTLIVPYPDALEYSGARYSGHATIESPPAGASGTAPTLARVTIVEARPVEGGSAYQVRARNANAAGTAPVRLVVTATTIEPLPHH